VESWAISAILLVVLETVCSDALACLQHYALSPDYPLTWFPTRVVIHRRYFNIITCMARILRYWTQYKRITCPNTVKARAGPRVNAAWSMQKILYLSPSRSKFELLISYCLC
jgi:hypothetical protein